jgi:hypothetical protein
MIVIHIVVFVLTRDNRSNSDFFYSVPIFRIIIFVIVNFHPLEKLTFVLNASIRRIFFKFIIT